MKVILAGNGINRVDNDYSWENLLNALISLNEENIHINENHLHYFMNRY